MPDLWQSNAREEATENFDNRWNSFFSVSRDERNFFCDHLLRWLRSALKLCERRLIERLSFGSRGVAREMAGHVRGWNHVRVVGAKANDRIFLRFSTTRRWSWKLNNWLGRCVTRTEHVRQCGGVVVPAISCGARFSFFSFWSAAAMAILIYSSVTLRSWSF